MPTDVSLKLEHLRRVVSSLDGAVVAFSGGTDSALVAAVAAEQLGTRALAVTAVSPSLPPGELAEARAFAERVGIRHRSVRTRETEREEYLSNGADRCYHCKSELYGVLGVVSTILFWLYIAGRLVLGAATLNASLYEQGHPEAAAPA